MAGIHYVKVVLDSFCKSLVDHIFVLIHKNSVGDLMQIFERIHPDNCTKILNYASDGYTLLYLAVKLERFETTKYLLRVSRRQGHREMCDQWKVVRHPLIAAMDLFNIQLTELIARSLFDINDAIYGSMTPLIMSVLTGRDRFIELLIELGADVNVATSSGLSPLRVSIQYPNACRFLLTTKVNLNHQDDDGNTAVHIAASERKWQSLIRLVDAGADIRIKNKEGMTPLMVASINLNVASIKYLSRRPHAHSDVEKIEAYEVLGACNVFAAQPVIDYWSEALELRGDKYVKSSPYPPQAILDNTKEFTTDAELDGFQDKPLQLAFQAVLIIERVLGRTNRTYLDIILKTAMAAKHTDNIVKTRKLVNYIFGHCQSTSANLVTTSVLTIKLLFEKLTEDANEENLFKNGGFVLFKLIAQTTETMWLSVKDRVSRMPNFKHADYSSTLDLFLYMTAVIAAMDLRQANRRQFIEVVKKLVAVDPRIVNHQSLLHRAVSYLDTQPWASAQLLRVLAEAGADLQATDYIYNTPMLYAFKFTPVGDLPVILAFFHEHGLHPDCIDDNYVFALKFAHSVTQLMCRRDAVLPGDDASTKEPFDCIVDDILKLRV